MLSLILDRLAHLLSWLFDVLFFFFGVISIFCYIIQIPQKTKMFICQGGNPKQHNKNQIKTLLKYIFWSITISINVNVFSGHHETDVSFFIILKSTFKKQKIKKKQSVCSQDRSAASPRWAQKCTINKRLGWTEFLQSFVANALLLGII